MPFLPDENTKVELTAEDFDIKKGVEVNPEDRFVSKKPQDIWAALLFFIHLFITAIYGGSALLYYNLVLSSDYSPPFDLNEVVICGSVMLVAFIIGCFFAVFFYFFTLKKPLLLLKLSAILYGLVLIAYGVLILVIAIIYMSIFLFIVAALDFILIMFMLIALFVLRKSFDLTAAYLKISAGIMQRFKGMIAALVLGVVAYAVFCIFWVAFFVSSFYYISPWIYGFGSIWMIFSWFWTTQVITGTIRVCVAGVVGRWYYEDCPSSSQVVIQAFKRAVFTSFGSVCFGSLITAILATITAMFRILYALNRGVRAQNLAQCIIKIFVACFLACFYVIFLRITHLVKFFNRYAFTFIAIYGMKFTAAGYATAKLLVTNGLEAVLNHVSMNIIVFAETMVIGFVSLLCSTGILCFIHFAISEIDPYVWAASEFLSLFLALGVGMISTEVITYCVPAVLVCSAHEPSKMPEKCPELLQLLQTRYPALQFLREIHV